MQIKKLEESLGRQLSKRDTRNVRPTPDGERLLTHAKQMVAMADAMRARFSVDEIDGEVRFGSPEDIASAHPGGLDGVGARAWRPPWLPALQIKPHAGVNGKPIAV